MAEKNLVIVESPAKARTIEKYLGSNYQVVASMGHLRDLPKSTMGVDIDGDFTPQYLPVKDRADVIADLKKRAKSAGTVYLATDPDREGEAISWHLKELLNLPDDKAKRVTFNEITKKVVTESIQHPREIDQDLVDAQQARRVLDRIVGYQLSPLLWKKIRRGLSAGRVQSVATRMVVMREEEIEAFIPEEYWEISAKLLAHQAHGRKLHFTARLATLDGQKAVIANAEEAQKAVERIQKAHFAVNSIKMSEKRKMPAAPFTTSSLQQEASRKLGFTTAKTMQVVQQLYEGIDLEGEGTQGIVSYIRTDSVRISDEALNALREYIPERFGSDYLPEKPNEYKGRKNAQDAHEAIRPTDVHRTPDSIKPSLTKEQYNLYKLIYNRFLASQMMPALYETMTMEISGDGVGMRFYGEHKKFAGFTSVYEESTDDDVASSETTLPQLSEGDAVAVADVASEQHFTQPPSRYTEASLVRMMEEKGIGRPSTYAPTITTIIARGYVSREKKRLYPTELGRMVTSMMETYFEDIVDVEFTAELEDKLDKVEEGEMDWKQILRDLKRPVKIYALFERGEEDQPLLELLNRYSAASDMVTWEQTPPSLNPLLLTRFSSSTTNVSAQNLIVYCEETDRYRVLTATDFVTLSVDTDSGSYNVSGLAYEQQITSAIAYVTRDTVPTLHIATGHGELGEDSLSAFTTLLTNNHYNAVFEKLSDMTFASGDVLCILSPVKDYTDAEMDIIRAYVQGGGAVLFSCDYTDPIENMPNVLSLLRSYGFLPESGLVMASPDETDTFYNNNRLALLPEMQATDVTLEMMLNGRTAMLMVASRGFDPSPESDNSLLVDAVLTTSSKSYLVDTTASRLSITQSDSDKTGPFALALQAKRFTDTGDVSRAFIIGSSALLTEEQLFTMTDGEEFLVRAVSFLTGDDSIDTSIMVKTALRPGLSVNALSLGSVVLVGLPILVLLAAVIILLPRRNL